MRTGWFAAFALVALLSGCKREPTFEERYKAANRTIVDRARQIDAQIAATGSPPLEDDGPTAEQ